MHPLIAIIFMGGIIGIRFMLLWPKGGNNGFRTNVACIPSCRKRMFSNLMEIHPELDYGYNPVHRFVAFIIH